MIINACLDAARSWSTNQHHTQAEVNVVNALVNEECRNPLTEETSEYDAQIPSTGALMQQRALPTSQHQQNAGLQ
jgi:hypothetical protein